MVGAVRSAVVDVECLIGEWFLHTVVVSDDAVRAGGRTYVATMTVKTIAMVFAFQLTVRGGHRLLFYRQITTAALARNND